MFDPGNHSMFWDGKDNSGFSVSSGVYIYILRADDAVNKLTTSVSGKMILGR
jgi:flagellar hook assembly protein FlgD